MFTLLLTLVGVFIARRVRIQSQKAEPWSLANLEGELWLLKRNSPVLATIHGIVIEEAEHIKTARIEGRGFSFMNPANTPAKFFANGTSILIKINPRMVEAIFILYYEEHKKYSKLSDSSGYHPDMKREDAEILPSSIKTWTATLY
jgi:hypothetical protein